MIMKKKKHVRNRFLTGLLAVALVVSWTPVTGAVGLTCKAGPTTVITAKAAEADWVPDTDCYSLSGDKINESGWFTGNVSVVAKDGYEVSYIQTDGYADWKKTLADAVTADGGDNSVSFYVKNLANGWISKQYTEIVKKDAVAPAAAIEIESLTIWEKFLTIITFGTWKKDTADFTIQCEDAASGIAGKEYYIAEGNAEKLSKSELDAVTTWTEYQDTAVPVSKDKIFVVYAKVTDTAGNYVYASTNGVVFDATAPEADIEILSEGVNGFYSEDVEVKVSVSDAAPYSGIKSVSYRVECDGNVTKEETVIYSFESENPKYSDLKQTWDSESAGQKIIIDAFENDSDNVIFYVTVTDNAGNIFKTQKSLRIRAKDPVINVDFKNDPAPVETYEDIAYYDGDREAEVIIQCRTSVFDEEKAKDGIKITAVDAQGNTVESSYTVGTWVHAEGDKPDDATHTVKIKFAGNANYSFTVDYMDKAGHSAQRYNSNTFVVDKDKPTGTIRVGELGFWDKLLEKITFGLWSKDTVTVSGTAADATSPVETVSYYKTADTIAMTEETLEKLEASKWKVFNGSEFDSFDVPANEQFTVYVRIVDFAGNTTYISTDGIIVDNTKPEFEPALEDNKPEITLAPVENDLNGLYNSDVTVAVKVVDPIMEDTYSGLKEIRYEVLSMGEKTQEGVLYSFTETAPTRDKLLQMWDSRMAEIGKYITVDSKRNNSNDVTVKVYAVDNAGNENEDALSLKIDVTKPSIVVSYDNNAGDTAFEDGTYFKANRTASIVISERNFNPDKVKVTITNEHGTIPVLSGWTTISGAGNGDNTTHTANVTYEADGDYTFNITYTDEAGNANDPVDYGASLAPQKFTVDKTLPTFSIAYDNNEAANGNYYKAQRIATLTVTEHNFETSRVKITLNATDNGQQTAAPAVSGWSSNGDVHTATITYAADALYTFDFDYQDKAGNATADIAEQTFYVDKTNPAVSITKIVDQSANSGEGNIGFVITATDTNFDIFVPVLTAVIKNGDGFETKQLDIGAVSDIANGKTYTVENIEADGIYRITCTVVDKAGNAYSEITLQKNDGSSYIENRSGNNTLVTFSVNRGGSDYEMDDDTADIVTQYYIQNVVKDIAIIEINADPLLEYKVTLNGKGLIENQDYTVTQTGDDGSWLKYTYVISKSLFENEGEYKIVVSSKDKAENDAFSDVKDATVSFVVDRTAPVVTVTGLAANGRYQTDKQVVTIIPTDDGGALNSLIVRMVDESGKETKELINLSGKTLEEALEAGFGKIVFEIEEGLYQNVQIICNDCAVDEEGNTNTYDEIFTNVSVSSSAFMIFWANRPLRYGVIAGTVVAAAAVILLIVLKKRKKKEQ